MFLHTSSFMQRFFYTQVLFTQTYFDTQWQVLLHKYFCTVMFFHRGVFFSLARTHTHTACSFTWMFLNTHVFTQRYLYKEVVLHADAITSRGSLTKECIYTRSFFIRTFLRRHTLARFPTSDTNFARESSASRCNMAISPQLLIIETHFVLKGCASTNKIAISLVFNRI